MYLKISEDEGWQSIVRKYPQCILNAYQVLPKAIIANVSEITQPVAMQPYLCLYGRHSTLVISLFFR